MTVEVTVDVMVGSKELSKIFKKKIVSAYGSVWTESKA